MVNKQLMSDDLKAVLNALKSNLITQGPLVERFESSLSDYFGSKHCCACFKWNCSITFNW